MKPSYIAFLLAAGLAAQGDNLPRPTPPANQPTIVQQVRVAPGQLQGKLLDSATRQPVGGNTFQLLDNTGKKIADIATTADGTYATPPLPKGSYTLALGNDLKLHLAVDEAATVNTLDIVVPKPAAGQDPSPKDARQPALPDPNAVPPAPGGAAPLPAPVPVTGPGMGVGSWALITAGAATVAVPVVAARRSGKEVQTSPSGLGVRR